jgi:hypothetical protein
MYVCVFHYVMYVWMRVCVCVLFVHIVVHVSSIYVCVCVCACVSLFMSVRMYNIYIYIYIYIIYIRVRKHVSFWIHGCLFLRVEIAWLALSRRRAADIVVTWLSRTRDSHCHAVVLRTLLWPDCHARVTRTVTLSPCGHSCDLIVTHAWLAWFMPLRCWHGCTVCMCVMCMISMYECPCSLLVHAYVCMYLLYICCSVNSISYRDTGTLSYISQHAYCDAVLHNGGVDIVLVWMHVCIIHAIMLENIYNDWATCARYQRWCLARVAQWLYSPTNTNIV